MRPPDPGGGPPRLTRMIGPYLVNSPGLIAAMRTALAQGDPERLGRGARDLRGTSATLGATRLAEVCLALEVEARAGWLRDAAIRLAILEAEYVRVREALETELVDER